MKRRRGSALCRKRSSTFWDTRSGGATRLRRGEPIWARCRQRNGYSASVEPSATKPGEIEPCWIRRRWYLGHVIIENRHGLVVAACATQSSTRAEREAALAMLDERARATTALGPKRITLGADKLYQEQKFIEGLRQRGIAPHVAEYEKASTYWPNFLNEAERHDPGFALSQKKRKQVEMVFGWGKLDSILRKFKLQGVERIDWLFRLLATANNLVRMVKLSKLIPAQ